jgi:hypothetical protein
VNAHIVVATPCYGGLVTHHFASSVLRLQKAAIEAGMGLTVRMLGGDALITRARNILVDEFLKLPDATHLLFIDADIGFEADQVFRLLAADKDVCGAAYPLKGRIGGEMHYVVDIIPGGEAIDGFARASYLGTGFMMIRRSVFDRFAAHYPAIAYRGLHAPMNIPGREGGHHAFFDCMIDPVSGIYLSEDFTFCKRWVEMGGEIWVDLDSRLTHIGATEYRGDLSGKLRVGP